MARGRGTARKKQSVKDKELAKKPEAGPKSMVIRIGAQEVGRSVSDLVNDVRHCLEVCACPPDKYERWLTLPRSQTQLSVSKSDGQTSSGIIWSCVDRSEFHICCYSLAPNLETQTSGFVERLAVLLCISE